MVSLSDALTLFCEPLSFDKTFWIALSGGLDSSVLLHLAAKLRLHSPIKLKAIHVHHGLSQHADDWLQHCEAICHAYHIPFVAKKINAKSVAGESPEAIARDHRYACFADLLGEGDVLLTAHHQDDQAETVLLQLFRGASTKGLSAMPVLKPFANGFLGRPLLNFSRLELQRYSEENALQFITDESNTQKSFARNFIRHDIMPLLTARWPSIAETLARTAEHCAELETLLSHLTKKELDQIRGTVKGTLSVKKLLEVTPELQKHLLRQWMIENNYKLPSAIKMQHMLEDILHADQDRSPCITWGTYELRRYRDDLYLMQRQADVSLNEMVWDFQTPLRLSARQVLRAVPVVGEGLSQDIKNVTVRFRQGGEKFQLPGRKHRHDLKKLFQAWGVAPWVREQTPLLFVAEDLAAIVGFGVAEPFMATQKGWKLILES